MGIGVDLDEVLGGFVPALIEWHNHTYGTEITLEGFHSYRFCDVWGGSNEEATEKVHEFFNSDYFTDMKPIEGAREALESLKEHFDLVVITSRQHVIRDQTLEWLGVHFPGVFKTVMFGNHWARDCPEPDKMSATKKSKQQMCEEAGAICLIDDSVDYARKCAPQLQLCVLFGDYAWNTCTEGLPENVVRVANWQEATEVLNQL